jgi:hypothetical protein
MNEEERINYYHRPDVLFELIKQMKGKELTFLGEEYNVRCMKAHTLAFLQTNMLAFNFYKRKYNLYISSANYFNLPVFSFNPKTRKEQQNVFNREYLKYVTGYDFFIDIDGESENVNLAYSEAKKIKFLFDKYSLPYSIKFSGKGFHFLIQSEYWDSIPDYKQRNIIFKNLSTSIKKVLGLTLIDLSVYDLRRVYKLAYSIDYKTGRVALPVSDEEFDNFDVSMTLPNNVLKKGIINRGLLIRKGTADSIKKFMRDYL